MILQDIYKSIVGNANISPLNMSIMLLATSFNQNSQAILLTAALWALMGELSKNCAYKCVHRAK